MHFSKQFIPTAHNRLPAKICNLLKILKSSLKRKCFINEYISAINDTVVIGLFCFFHFFVSLPFHHTSFSFLSWLLTVCFLIVLPLSEIVTLCCALSIYVCQIKLYEMHRQVIIKNWFIFDWSNALHLLSLVKLKIHLRKSSIQDIFANGVWWKWIENMLDI